MEGEVGERGEGFGGWLETKALGGRRRARGGLAVAAHERPEGMDCLGARDALLEDRRDEGLEDRAGPAETEPREPPGEVGDDRMKTRLEAGRIVEVDALALAMEAGGPATANVVLLGALSCLPEFPLTGEAMKRGIEAAGNKAYLERNLLSLAKGREHGRRLEN